MYTTINYIFSYHSLYLHQQLYKANIFVQRFDGFHFFLSEWKIKYLEQNMIICFTKVIEMNLCILYEINCGTITWMKQYYNAQYILYYDTKHLVNPPGSCVWSSLGWSSWGSRQLLSGHWSAEPPGQYSCCTFSQWIRVAHPPAGEGISHSPLTRDRRKYKWCQDTEFINVIMFSILRVWEFGNNNKVAVS